MAITKNSQIDLNGNEMILDADGDTTITADTDDQIDFKVAGTDRITIDASGDVLVGTSTINTGTLGTSNKFLEVSAGTASGSGTLILSRNTSTNDVELGGVRFVNANNADDDGLDADGKLVAAVSARSVTSDSNAGDDSGADLIFYTKPEAGNYAERLRINSSGNSVFSGDTITVGDSHTFGNGSGDNLHIESSSGENIVFNAAGGIHVFQNNGTEIARFRNDELLIGGTVETGFGVTIAASSGLFLADIGSSANGITRPSASHSYNALRMDNSGAVQIGAISVGTTGGSILYGGSSDYRMKENIQVMEKGLERVKKLNPVKFTWKEEFGGGENEGFIAHEIQEAGWNEGVVGEKDGEEMQLVDYGKLTPLLVKAIQEQQEQIESLQQEIEALKNGN
jgi:hypothetical protein